MTKNQFFVKTLWTIMKISCLPIFLVMLTFGLSVAKDALGQELLDRRITLDVRNQELKDVLSKIEKSANVKFSFVPQIVGQNDKISFSVKEETLETMLNKVLKPLHINYEVAGKYIVLTKNAAVLEQISIKSYPNVALADVNIKGKVTAENGMGVSDCSRFGNKIRCSSLFVAIQSCY
jgi:hypothetical protein